MTHAVADTLRRAKALIDTPEKWWNGHGFCPLGSGCSVGAIETAAGLNESVSDAAVRAMHGGVGASSDLCEWNDAPGRTHAEIIAAFDAAIAAEESEP